MMKITQNMKFNYKVASDILDFPPELNLIISAGFEKCGDVVFAKQLAGPTPESIANLLNDCIDFTGVECYLNKLHIEDFCSLNGEYSHRDVVSIGVNFARCMAKAILVKFPTESFRLIVSEEEGELPSVVFRFHKIREGESWLAPDLESYSNGVYVVDTE